MAQFDVHRNQGLQRDTMPFVVLVQSGKYDSYRGRVVVPLVRRSALSATTPTVGSRLNPVLGDYVASLASQGELIVQALNELLSSTSA